MRPVSPPPYRLRPALSHCRGGASSLLRLTKPQAARLPSGAALEAWAARAAQMLPAPELPATMVAPAADAASPLFTRLWPRGAAHASSSEVA